MAAGQARDSDGNVDFGVARCRGEVEADLAITKTGPSRITSRQSSIPCG